MDKYNCVIITTWKDRSYRYIVKDENECKEYIKKHPDAIEII